MLGGRAAEEVVYGTRTTGAENDIEQATALARNMVTRWGMSDRARHGAARAARESVPRRRPAASAGTEAVQRARPRGWSTPRCSASSARATTRRGACSREHRDALDALAQALLARETLDEEEILAATGLPPAPALEGLPLPKASN